MSGNNGSHFVGVISRDPDIKGKQARVSLAVRRSRRRDGEPDVDFVPLTFLTEKAVEFVQTYLAKGRWIAATGVYRTFTWESNGETHYGHEFVVDQDGVSFVGPKPVDGDGGSANSQTASRGASANRGGSSGRTSGQPSRNTSGRSTGSSASHHDDDDVPF